MRRFLALVAVAVAIGSGVAGAEPERRHRDAAGAPVPWTTPPVDSCEPAGGLQRWPPGGGDAGPLPFQPGDSFDLAGLETLRDFLPPFIWEYRDRFFFAGMRLEIGRCFADYSPPAFFQSATARHASQAKLTSDGGIVDYTAGLPFPPDRIEPQSKDAGARWAWNFELRYQAAGFWGDFRTTDMVGRDGRGEPFVGEIFKAQTAFRADRARDGYRAPGADGKHWVAGGRMLEPFDARHFSWRQYRDLEHLTQPERSDDVHAWLPDFRRVRRLPSSGIEGLYMPSFSVGVVKPQMLSGLTGGLGGVGGGLGGAAVTVTAKRSGFEGVELRPLLYEFRVLGVQDVLIPINANTPSFPEDAERHFGPWGLSFASDRWDLRRAVVVEGRAREQRSGDRVQRFVQYFDVQTLAPLYYASWDYRDEQIDVGMYVGRWSEERADYPRWPDDPDRAIRVIDPVGASFANISIDGGWRRESWTTISTPPPDEELLRKLSVNELTKQK